MKGLVQSYDTLHEYTTVLTVHMAFNLISI